MSKKGEILRDLLEGSRGIFVPGVSSPQSARALRKTGFKFLYVGGYAEAALNGYPDMGLRTATEVVRHVESIADAVEDALLIVDLDDGYGDVKNVHRTVRSLLKKVDVAAIHIEDQKYPKRCGHIAGREVVPIDQFKAKLKVAMDVRNELNPSCIIIARTDALGAVDGGMKEAVRRGREYAELGADMVWCETKTQDRDIAREFSARMTAFPLREGFIGLAYNISLSFDWNDSSIFPVTVENLFQWGYKLRFATYPATVAEVLAVYNLGLAFSSGDPIEVIRKLQQSAKGTIAESIMRFAGTDFYQHMETRYDSNVAKRLNSSEGFGGRQ